MVAEWDGGDWDRRRRKGELSKSETPPRILETGTGEGLLQRLLSQAKPGM